jgi:S-adenosylmethionine uptake transporter
MTATQNTRAALLMTLSMGCYALNDTCMKALGVDLPLGQLLFLRGVLTSILVGAWVAWRGQWRVRLIGADWRRVALRTTGEVGAAFFFISALFHMPLANATAILQALPLTVALAAAVFLGEPLGWRRISAILVGFVGVLLIVRPGPEGFNAYTLFALAAVGMITLRDLATRRIAGSVPTMVVVLFSSLGVMLLGAALGPFETWLPLRPAHVGLLVLSALFILLAYVLTVQVMRMGDAGATAPFRYTGLLWALLLGYFAFGEWPTVITLLGAVIVVATGVFTYYRECALARTAVRGYRC